MTKRRIFITVDTSRTCGSLLLKGIIKYSHENGNWTIYKDFPSYISNNDKGDTLKWLNSFHADGIILLENSENRKLIGIDLPMIVAPQTQKRFKGLPNIICHNTAIGKMAADYLLNRGFRSFAFYGLSNFFWSHERFNGFREYLAIAGFDVTSYIATASSFGDPWYKEQLSITEWLLSAPKPLGLMACNDDCGSAISAICHTARIRVPEDISIVGVDNDELICSACDPPLSSVVLNFEAAGHKAAALLNKLISRKNLDVKQSIIVEPTHIVTRHSSDIRAINNKEISEALDYIFQNSHKAIQVSDVAHAIQRPRRFLERHFRIFLGRSVHDEIRRCRNEKISELLVTTDMPISQIATSLDFQGIEKLDRYFRSEKQMSPLIYRKKYGI